MSKLDELLNYMARDGYGMPIGYLNTTHECRAELAALRQRAEDAEMMLRSAVRHGTCRDGAGVLFWDAHSAFDERFALDSTGLPILSDEARIALRGKA